MKRGHRLTVEGAPPGERLYLVVRGALEVAIEGADGKLRLSLRGPGHWAGHESFFSLRPQPFSVIARENTQLITFERATVEAIADRRDEIALDLYEQVTSELARAFNRDSMQLQKMMVERGYHASVSSADFEALRPD